MVCTVQSVGVVCSKSRAAVKSHIVKCVSAAETPWIHYVFDFKLIRWALHYNINSIGESLCAVCT